MTVLYLCSPIFCVLLTVQYLCGTDSPISLWYTEWQPVSLWYWLSCISVVPTHLHICGTGSYISIVLTVLFLLKLTVQYHISVVLTVPYLCGTNSPVSLWYWKSCISVVLTVMHPCGTDSLVSLWSSQSCIFVALTVLHLCGTESCISVVLTVLIFLILTVQYHISVVLTVPYLCGLFDLILYIPVNKCLVMSIWIFLGWTSTKQGLKIMCLAQGHNTVPPVRLEPASSRSWVTQAPPLSHCAPIW